MSNQWKKKSKEELMEYLVFRSRGSRVDAKKGKGAKYKRQREKEKTRKESEE